MAVGGVIHTDWLNENRNRRYPFLDSAAMRDETNTLEVPNNLIVDLSFPAPASAGLDFAGFYLKQLLLFPGGLTIILGYGNADAAVVTVAAADHVENRSYSLTGVGEFADCVGRVIIGQLDEVLQYGGMYTFSAAQTPLLPTVLRPALRGVRALRLVSAQNNYSEPIRGEIHFYAGDNVALELLTEPEQRVRISAVANPDYTEDCECPELVTGEPILTINNIGPDNQGNFSILGEGCLTVQSGTAAITLKDTCAEPCCGCAELEVLRAELNRLATQVATQAAFAQRAASNIEQLRDVVLVSRLGTLFPG